MCPRPRCCCRRPLPGGNCRSRRRPSACGDGKESCVGSVMLVACRACREQRQRRNKACLLVARSFSFWRPDRRREGGRSCPSITLPRLASAALRQLRYKTASLRPYRHLPPLHCNSARSLHPVSIYISPSLHNSLSFGISYFALFPVQFEPRLVRVTADTSP